MRKEKDLTILMGSSVKAKACAINAIDVIKSKNSKLMPF